MVIRVLAVPDYLDLPSFDEVFALFLAGRASVSAFTFTAGNSPVFCGGRRPIGRACRIFNCGRGKPLYTCGGLDLWEWEFRVLAAETGTNGDDIPADAEATAGRRVDGTPAQVEAVIALLRVTAAAKNWAIVGEH
jgi:hypothetical protein